MNMQIYKKIWNYIDISSIKKIWNCIDIIFITYTISTLFIDFRLTDKERFMIRNIYFLGSTINMIHDQKEIFNSF